MVTHHLSPGSVGCQFSWNLFSSLWKVLDTQWRYSPKMTTHSTRSASRATRRQNDANYSSRVICYFNHKLGSKSLGGASSGGAPYVAGKPWQTARAGRWRGTPRRCYSCARRVRRGVDEYRHFSRISIGDDETPSVFTSLKQHGGAANRAIAVRIPEGVRGVPENCLLGMRWTKI